MKSLYIINKSARGSLYGIGTYIDTLLKCVQGMDLHVNVVLLNDETIRETTVETNQGVRYIRIPDPVYYPAESANYQVSVGWLLKEFVDERHRNIFHLHRMDLKHLAATLKHDFSGRIILTMHYTTWSLALSGDRKRLSRILAKPVDDLTVEEKYIREQCEDETELLDLYCDHIVAISEHSRQSLLSDYHINPGKITLIPNALPNIYRSISNEKKQALRRRYNITGHEKVIIFAGRLDAVKGIHFLIRAFKKVLASHPDARLVIAGSGDMASVFRTSRYVWSRIVFTGFLPKRELYQLYSIADIGVVPSLYEEFGYVAVEMMMHKVPVIVNKTTGLEEIIEDGRDGLHVNLHSGRKQIRKSVDDLTDKLRTLLEDREHRREMAVKARKKFLERYEIKLFQTRIKELYEQESTLKVIESDPSIGT